MESGREKKFENRLLGPTISFLLFLRFFASSLFFASHFPNYDVIVTLSSDATAFRFA